MSDIIDINVAQTVEEVTINVVDNVIQVNINQVNGGGGIESVVAGTNITVDNTDPLNPIINANADAVTSVNSDTGAVIVDLESVLNEGSTADNSITLQGASALFKVADADENKILEYNPISGNLDIAYPLTYWQLSEDKITRGQNSFQTDLTFTNPTANRVITFKDETGTVALTSDIPSPITIDATPTDGSSNAVSSNGVFDALALKQRDLRQFQTKEGFLLFDDFLGNSGVNNSSSEGWNRASSGAGASCIQTTTYPNRTNQQGVVKMNAGTTTTGVAHLRLGDNNNPTHYLGNGEYTMEYPVNIETLSTVTEEFYDIFGGTTSAVFANTNGIFFLYDRLGLANYGGTGSVNWKCVTRSGGVVTVTTTSTAVTASAWVNLKIVVNAGATSVGFYIDNVLVATNTTNIPPLITPRLAHQKTAGTTSRSAFVDYALLQQIYTTPR